MAIDVTRTLRKALVDLQAEGKQIARQIAAIKRAMDAGDGRGSARARRRRARKPMNAAARRAISRRMKANWAKRKAARKKAKE